MNHVKLLDCTLRDGAYLLDKKFGNETISGIIKGLVETQIDFIEIGFFQNAGFGDGKTVFRNSSDAKRFIPKDKKGCLFTVLADYSRYDVSNLDNCQSDSIDAIRECFFKHERFEAIEACEKIKNKGYKVFIQPVDILGYSDKELIEFLDLVNQVEPECLSIVDTFGSMYQEDLHRIFEIIHHNLLPSCRIGFHSHNNMQLSNALSQEFIRLSTGRRNIVIDGTISGMGRGAGNTPTELIVEYVNTHINGNYDMDSLLDTIDIYMDNIRSKCSWGYSTPFFVAGCYGAHVNNIAYLTQKNSIKSKDIRYVLNKIGAQARKRYDYVLLENTYMDLMKSNIDDSEDLEKLRKCIHDRKILILVPGSSVVTEKEKILKFVENENPIIIAVNFVPDYISADYIYTSNVRRFEYWRANTEFEKALKIITSNIMEKSSDNKTYIISFTRLIKTGVWEHLDNSTILLLRLLDILNSRAIYIAGFDGYDYKTKNTSNYISEDLELSSPAENPVSRNIEISDMLKEYMETRENKNVPISFITPSRFENCLTNIVPYN